MSQRLNLPKSDAMPLRRDPKKDSATVQFWKKSGAYKEQAEKDSTFHLMDGPPYANGEPHLGHFLNKVLKDMVVRSQNYLGNSTAFKPGWDCHGLPLELAVEKRLGTLPPSELKYHCARLAKKSVAKSRRAFMKSGVRAAWGEPYLTLSSELRTHTYTTLKTLFDRNLLQYKKSPVHMCPVCQSSLSDAELENAPAKKESLFFLVELAAKQHPLLVTNHTTPIRKPVYALVWTTTPWTVPMNKALAYAPGRTYTLQEYDTHFLLGENLDKFQLPLDDWNYRTERFVSSDKFPDMFDGGYQPLLDNRVEVVPADFVTANHTGWVHVVPAHGMDDFALGLKHNLSQDSLVGTDGFYHNLPPSLAVLNGKHVGNASADVVALLKARNLLTFHGSTKEEQPHCWRHKVPVFYLATNQVFLDLEPLKPKVNAMLDQTDLTESDKKALSGMMMARPNWCLSRQRQWGRRLYLWVDENNNLVKENSEYLQAQAEQNWPKVLELNADLKARGYTLVLDVLDVWFDSGNLGVAYHNVYGKTPDMVVEGRDQFRGWFQSLMWLSLACLDGPAFKNMMWHGFVLDKEKQKLSKSKGNAATLDTYLNEFGADVMRLWAGSATFGQDVAFSKEKLGQMKTFYDRFRLTLRYALSNLYDYTGDTSTLLNDLNTHAVLSDVPNMVQGMVAETLELEAAVSESYKKYEFRQALDLLYGFCEKRLSNFYFDSLKSCLYLDAADSKDRLLVQAGLCTVAEKLVQLLDVLCPFLAEEVRYLLPQAGYVLQREDNHSTKDVYEARTQAAALPEVQKHPKSEFKLTLPYTEDFSWRFSPARLASFVGFSEVEDGEKMSAVSLKDQASHGKCSRCWCYVTVDRLKDGMCC